MSGKSKRPDSAQDPPQRLQRVMAAGGIGSRRQCEQLIVEGHVEVDGKVVTELGVKVDPVRQKIFVDGERLRTKRRQYFMLNKPPGVVSTARDPSGRLRVVDLINTDQRVYNVGRLDKSSEGLILVTNDGDLANQLTHPRYGVEKKYHVLVRGVPTRDQLDLLRKGVYLAEAKVQVANVRIRKRHQNGCWLEMILDEGRNREIRRVLAKIGHKVVRLQRVAIGPLHLGDLPVGAHRRLTADEIKLLLEAASRSGRRASRAKKTAPTKKPAAAKTTRANKQTSTKVAGRRSAKKKTTPGRASNVKSNKRRAKVAGTHAGRPKRGKSATKSRKKRP